MPPLRQTLRHLGFTAHRYRLSATYFRGTKKSLIRLTISGKFSNLRFDNGPTLLPTTLHTQTRNPTACILHLTELWIDRIAKLGPPNFAEAGLLEFCSQGFEIPHP